MWIRDIVRDKGGEVVCVDAGVAVRDAVALLHAHRIGAVLATEAGQIAGVLSERDIVRGLHTVGARVLDEPVHGCMSAPVVTVGLGDTIDSALALMTERRFRHLPVIDGGKLVGVVSIGDLVKHRIEEADREAASLKDYIAA